MKYEIIERIEKIDSCILAINTDDEILIGGSNKRLFSYPEMKVLCSHKKSIKSIAKRGDYICCGSYDCTATLLYKKEVIDVIEGPETEIKCVSFSENGNYLALSTRGGSVWICKMNNGVEIDKILEDHINDVKGCLFYDNFFISYGYDNSIKVYEKLEYDESWELVQSIEEKSTVLFVGFINNHMVSSNSIGEINIYELISGWNLVNSKKMSMLPIYSFALVNDRIVYVLNRGSIGVTNFNLEFLGAIENLHKSYINCISYFKKKDQFVTGGDDGDLIIIKAWL